MCAGRYPSYWGVRDVSELQCNELYGDTCTAVNSVESLDKNRILRFYCHPPSSYQYTGILLQVRSATKTSEYRYSPGFRRKQAR